MLNWDSDLEINQKEHKITVRDPDFLVYLGIIITSALIFLGAIVYTIVKAIRWLA